MSNFRQMILVCLVILTAMIIAACGTTSPAVTATPTLENTPLPTMTPTPELPQRPHLPAPAMEGAVDVGGYKLRYQCYGEGTPTIVVEAAAWDPPTRSLSWNAVIQKVQSVTRICIYDRVAGVRTSQDVAEDLHFLLGEIQVPPPYILVGHSLGGWHVRVFAHLYPDEVAGMILVDSTPTSPDIGVLYATAYPTYSPDESPGIAKNRMSEDDITNGTLLPSFDGLDMGASNEQVRQAGSFGDIPLVVICHTPGSADLLGLAPDVQEPYAATILKIQADLAKLSSKGEFVAARTSNHFISIYEPQIIIDAMIRMVEEIRTGN